MTAPLRSHGKLFAVWERMCLNKSRWTDEYVARAVANHALTHHEDVGAERLYVYRCRNCRGWHLTKSRRHNGRAHPVTRDDLYAPVEERRPQLQLVALNGEHRAP